MSVKVSRLFLLVVAMPLLTVTDCTRPGRPHYGPTQMPVLGGPLVRFIAPGTPFVFCIRERSITNCGTDTLPGRLSFTRVVFDDAHRVTYVFRDWQVPAERYQLTLDSLVSSLSEKFGPATACGNQDQPWHAAHFWQGPEWVAQLTAGTPFRMAEHGEGSAYHLRLAAKQKGEDTPDRCMAPID
jgi:hypothetical protein